MKIDLASVSFRPLDESYIPALLEIQEETFAHAYPDTDFLRRNTEETFRVCFPHPSLVVGAYLGEEMIAFGILHAAGETKENLALDIEDVGDVRENANVKLTIVRPQYRGNGLQAALIAQMEEHAKREGFLYLSSTVAPDNPYSRNNLEKRGFSPYKVLKKYGGKDRILYFKKL